MSCVSLRCLFNLVKVHSLLCKRMEANGVKNFNWINFKYLFNCIQQIMNWAASNLADNKMELWGAVQNNKLLYREKGEQEQGSYILNKQSRLVVPRSLPSVFAGVYQGTMRRSGDSRLSWFKIAFLKDWLQSLNLVMWGLA